MLTSLLISWIAHQATTPPQQPPLQQPKPPQVAPSSPLPLPNFNLSPVPAASKVVATVNGVAITAGEVDKYLWDWEGDNVIENLVNFEIVAGTARRLKLTVSPKDVDAALSDQIEQVRRALPPGSDAWAAIKAKGYSPTRLRLTVKTQLLLEKVALTEFKPADYVKVSTIIVPIPSGPTPSPDQLATAQKTALALYDQLKKGDTWQNVLNASTTDEQVRKNGGYVGWKALSVFPADAQPAIRQLKPGGFTAPYKTANGYQLFRLDVTGLTATPSDLASLQQQFAYAQRQQLMKKLKAEAKVVTVH